MKTLFNFLKKHKNEPLTQENFTAIDALILAQISYFRLEYFVPHIADNRPRGVYLSTINKKNELEVLTNYVLIPKQEVTLCNMLRESTRYKGLRMNFFEDSFDKEKDSQFAAVTLFINDVIFVSYRGTDTTITGWKEDFNMAIYREVPSQNVAFKYLNAVAERIEGKFFVGGHSKGGNLAEYAAIFCDKEIQDRIIHVFNFDGPGFNDDIVKREEYIRIKDRTSKYIPQQSFVGALLNFSEDFTIVKSTSVSLFQHNPFSWGVNLKTSTFLKAKSRSQLSVVMSNTITESLNNMTIEQRELFINFLFEIFKLNDIDTLEELKLNKKGKRVRLLNAYRTIKADYPEQSEVIKSILKKFKMNIRRILKNKKQYLEDGPRRLRPVEELNIMRELRLQTEDSDCDIEIIPTNFSNN